MLGTCQGHGARVRLACGFACASGSSTVGPYPLGTPIFRLVSLHRLASQMICTSLRAFLVSRDVATLRDPAMPTKESLAASSESSPFFPLPGRPTACASRLLPFRPLPFLSPLPLSPFPLSPLPFSLPFFPFLPLPQPRLNTSKPPRLSAPRLRA